MTWPFFGDMAILLKYNALQWCPIIAWSLLRYLRWCPHFSTHTFFSNIVKNNGATAAWKAAISSAWKESFKQRTNWFASSSWEKFWGGVFFHHESPQCHNTTTNNVSLTVGVHLESLCVDPLAMPSLSSPAGTFLLQRPLTLGMRFSQTRWLCLETGGVFWQSSCNILS